MFKKILIFALLIILSPYAKSQLIKGSVFEITDKKEKIPLTGVTIFWIETNNGCISDTKGNFEINSSGIKDRRLIFRMVGYTTDTIFIDHNLNKIEQRMVPSTTRLKEVEISENSGSFINKMSPRNVQIITTGELYKAACCNLGESFETNASVDVSYSDAVTGAKQIQLLGLSGVYSMVQTENVPLIRGMAAPFGLSYIPGSWMQSIQVAKGMASVINGYESITGQINVEYKKPAHSEKFFINLFANDKQRYELNTNFSHKFNDNLSTMLLVHADDYRKPFDRNKDNFMDMPKMNNISLMNRWDFVKSQRLNSHFGIKYMQENRQGGTMDYKESSFIEDTALINAGKLPYGFSMKTNRAEVFWKNGLLFPGKPFKSIALIVSGILHNQEGNFGLTNYFGNTKSAYANLLYQNIIGTSDHKITAGLSYHYDVYTENFEQKSYIFRYQYNGLTDVYNLFTITDSSRYFTKTTHNLDRFESVPGAFVEYTYNLLDKLVLIAGIRGDYHNKYGFFVTPRINVRYHLDSSITLRASAGLGYRTAQLISENISLLTSQRNFVFESNLKQEKAYNLGLNVTKEFKMFKRKAEISIDAYHTQFLQQVVVDMETNPTMVFFRNLDGKSYSNSYQIQWNFDPVKRFNVLLAYRYNDVKTSYQGQLLRKPFVNLYKGLINLAYATKFEKWKFDFTTQINGGSRLPDQSQMPASLVRAENTPVYLLFNAQITKRFKRLELYLGGENLGDFRQTDPITEYFQPYHTHFDSSMGWGPVVGRTVYVGLRYTVK